MEKFNYASLWILSIFLFLLLTTQPLTAGITNGYFSDDPPGTGWTFGMENIFVTSDTTPWVGNGAATLRPDDESESSISSIIQNNIILQPTDQTLSFDIFMSKYELGGETDIFTATFGSEQYTKLSSSLTGSTYSETVTFDLTGWATGPSNPYTLSFQLENDPDNIFTSVTIDNVEITAIPAPGALILVLVGTSSVISLKRTKRI